MAEVSALPGCRHRRVASEMEPAPVERGDAAVRVHSGVTAHPWRALLPLIRVPIDCVAVALADRNHADDQLGLAQRAQVARQG